MLILFLSYFITTVILLIDQVAAIMMVKISKVYDFGISERFFYLFTKSFQKFELLPGVAEW